MGWTNVIAMLLPLAALWPRPPPALAEQCQRRSLVDEPLDNQDQQRERRQPAPELRASTALGRLRYSTPAYLEDRQLFARLNTRLGRVHQVHCHRSLNRWQPWPPDLDA